MSNDSKENEMEKAIDDALKKATEFISTGNNLTLDEIKNSLLLQKAIGSIMSKNWRKRNAQGHFIKMFVHLPDYISLGILKTTHEMFITTELTSLNDKEKQDWCNTVVKYIERIDKSKTEKDLSILSSKIMEIFNTEILYQEMDDFYDDDYDENEDNDDDVSSLPTTKEILKPKEISKSNPTKPQVDNNPNSVASTVLNGEQLKAGTIEKIKISKNFAIAYTNALSLQAVLGEAQEKNNVRLNYIKGLDYLNEELFIYAIEELKNRRKEIIPQWIMADQKLWFQAVKEAQITEKRELIFFKNIDWPKPKTSQNKKNNDEVLKDLNKAKPAEKEVQQNNEMYNDMEYFFETGTFKEGYFDKDFTKQDYKIMGKALSDIFMKYKHDEEKLERYSKAISYMDIDSFTHAIQCLVNNHKKMNIEFVREDKKKITLQILYQLQAFGIKDFDDYRTRLIHTISGYSQITETMKQNDDDDD